MKRSDFYVQAYIDNKKIYANVSNKGSINDKLQFAFYLYKENERKETQWYTLSTDVEFNVTEQGIFKVVAFIKEGDREPLIIESNYVEVREKDEESVLNIVLDRYKKVNVSEVPYWKSVEPFKDFAVIALKSSNYDEDKIKSIEKLEYKITKENFGDINSYIVHNDSFDIKKDNLYIFSGLGKIESKLYFGQESFKQEDINYLDMGKNVGLFTYLYADTKQIFLTQDYFGCGILFYYENEEMLIVSNRYHLLLVLMNKMTCKIEPNKESIAAVLGGRGNYSGFVSQNIFHEMGIKDTYQLPLNKEILIDQTGWKIIDKNIAIENISYDEKKYVNLLEQATKEIIENIHCIEECEKFKDIVCDLSGGMDSRVVFGGVLNANKSKNIKIRTKKTPGSRDLEIGVGLANTFGFDFYKEDSSMLEPLEVEDNSDIWRSYFMGCYHRTGFTTSSNKGKGINRVRLSGACGEYFRIFWSKLIKNVEQYNSKEVSEEIFADNIYDFKIKESIQNKLCEELQRLPGSTTNEKLEAHYMFFRGRYHFGMRQFETYHDCAIWFPLLSPALLEASRMLTLEERKSDKIIYEITERLCPILIHMEYDNKKEKDISTLNLSDKRYMSCKIKMDEDLEKWNETEKLNHEEKLTQIKEKNIQPLKDINEYLYSKILEGYTYLYNNHPEMHDIINEQLMLNIEVNKQNSMYMREMYSKIYSIIDQLNFMVLK